MCRFHQEMADRIEIDIPVQQPEPDEEDLSEDDLFLFCVGFTCEQAYKAGEDEVDYNKDITAMVIMEIVERHHKFPNPTKIVKRGMKDIVCLTFMKPPFMQNEKSSIVRRMLYSISHIPGLNGDDKEELKQLFHTMIKRLVTEDPTTATVSCVLEPLASYFTKEDEPGSELVMSSISTLCMHALKNNIPMMPLSSILPDDLWGTLCIVYEVHDQTEVVDAFPVLCYDE